MADIPWPRTATSPVAAARGFGAGGGLGEAGSVEGEQDERCAASHRRAPFEALIAADHDIAWLDRAVFDGYAAAGIQGVRQGSSNPTLTLPANVRGYPDAVAQAVNEGRTGNAAARGEDIGEMAEPPVEQALEA